MKIQEGQNNIISKYFNDYDKENSYIMVEIGNDIGHTFNGVFVAKIFKKNKKGCIVRCECRFKDGKKVLSLT